MIGSRRVLILYLSCLEKSLWSPLRLALLGPLEWLGD
jgi:hypothetical protein